MSEINELHIALDAGYRDGQADAYKEITSLRSQLNEAREALKPFAEALENVKGKYGDDSNIGFWLRVGDLKRARSFLSKTEGKKDE